MNTYPARRASDLPEYQKKENIEKIKNILDAGLQVCVRLENFYYSDDEDDCDTIMYGIYSKTDEEVRNYDNSGGLWGYYNSFDFDN
jgi:hypothetical protein